MFSTYVVMRGPKCDKEIEKNSFLFSLPGACNKRMNDWRHRNSYSWLLRNGFAHESPCIRTLGGRSTLGGRKRKKKQQKCLPVSTRACDDWQRRWFERSAGFVFRDSIRAVVHRRASRYVVSGKGIIAAPCASLKKRMR